MKESLNILEEEVQDLSNKGDIFKIENIVIKSLPQHREPSQT